jgi:hypothetical protein
MESLLMYQSRFHPPGQDVNGLPFESFTSTHLNNKWLEGQRQKGWTPVTLCMTLNVALAEKTTAPLLGQGDNQVIILKILSDDILQRRGQSVSQYIQGFFDHLQAMSLRMGIITKPEVSYHLLQRDILVRVHTFTFYFSVSSTSRNDKNKFEFLDRYTFITIHKKIYFWKYHYFVKMVIFWRDQSFDRIVPIFTCYRKSHVIFELNNPFLRV